MGHKQIGFSVGWPPRRKSRKEGLEERKSKPGCNASLDPAIPPEGIDPTNTSTGQDDEARFCSFTATVLERKTEPTLRYILGDQLNKLQSTYGILHSCKNARGHSLPRAAMGKNLRRTVILRA